MLLAMRTRRSAIVPTLYTLLLLTCVRAVRGENRLYRIVSTDSSDIDRDLSNRLQLESDTRSRYGISTQATRGTGGGSEGGAEARGRTSATTTDHRTAERMGETIPKIETNTTFTRRHTHVNSTYNNHNFLQIKSFIRTLKRGNCKRASVSVRKTSKLNRVRYE